MDNRLKEYAKLLIEVGLSLREGQTLEALFEQRSVLYEKYADIIIEENKLTLEETVRTVYLAVG